MTDRGEPTSVARVELDAVRHNLERMGSEIEAALPPNVTLERFIRIALTAVQRDPKLMLADRASLYMACLECAEDGLLPDKREGAFVVFKGRVQWLPMVSGLVKLAWDCGGISSLHADAAYVGEIFEVWGGTNPRVVHSYNLDARGDGSQVDNLLAVYATAKLSSGETMQAVLTPREVEKIRNVSQAERGPWSVWYIEMAKVRAIKRLSKLLPMSGTTEAARRLRRAVDRVDIIDDVTAEPAAALPTPASALSPPTDKLSKLEATLELKPEVVEVPPAFPPQANAQSSDSQARSKASTVLQSLERCNSGEEVLEFLRRPWVRHINDRLRENWPDLWREVAAATAKKIVEFGGAPAEQHDG